MVSTHECGVGCVQAMKRTCWVNKCGGQPENERDRRESSFNCRDLEEGYEPTK